MFFTNHGSNVITLESFNIRYLSTQNLSGSNQDEAASEKIEARRGA